MDDLDSGATVRGFTSGQKVFARYTLKRILGRGGMGVVWLARDEELERDVALKFLPEVVAMDREAVRDLKRETRRSLELTHPHIVRIYDFIQDGHAAAISMEYVEGETLAARKIDQPHGHFEVGEIAGWTKQLIDALEYAHTRAQVVHRDLKPANLMIDAGGFLKIADFGIAASVSDTVSRVSVQTGSSGTPVYMSPQQMMGEKPAVTDDVYALGATLYELLTGKPPFYSGNVIVQVQNKIPPSIAERRKELGVDGEPVPEAWERVVAGCLAKDSDQRPQSMATVADELFGAAPPKVATPDADVERMGAMMHAILTGGSPETTASDAAAEGIERGPDVAGVRPRSAGEAAQPIGVTAESAKGTGHGDVAAEPPLQDVMKDVFRDVYQEIEKSRAEPTRIAGSETTPTGLVLFWLFILSVAGIFVSGCDWVKRIDRPSPDTYFLRSGSEFNLNITTRQLTPNGAYRFKEANATLHVDGESEPRKLEVRDRGGHSWRGRITVQVRRLTGSALKEPVVIRISVPVPADPGLIGRTGTFRYDFLTEVPYLEDSASRSSQIQFQDREWRVDGDAAVKIIPVDHIPMERKARRISVLLAVGLFGVGVFRAYCPWFPGTRAYRYYNLAVLFFAANGIVFAWDISSGRIVREYDRDAALARVEQRIAIGDVGGARAILVPVLERYTKDKRALALSARIDAEERRAEQSRRIDRQQSAADTVGHNAIYQSAVSLEGVPGPTSGNDCTIELPGGMDLGMAWIDPGEFVMGSPSNEQGRYDSEGPQTRVQFTRGFWLGKSPVTHGQFRQFVEETRYRTEAERDPGKGMQIYEGGVWLDGPNRSWRNVFADIDRNPVVGVSWNDANAFCDWLTERERRAGRLPEGYVYTLPSEAQWEYACRAGTTTRYYTGNSERDLDRAGWYRENSNFRTQPVGQKAANAWGLYDMHGNVWEWTRTRIGDYPGGTVTDYEGPSSNSARVYRGGSWGSSGEGCRSACRNLSAPDFRGVLLGFRLALSSVQ